MYTSAYSSPLPLSPSFNAKLQGQGTSEDGHMVRDPQDSISEAIILDDHISALSLEDEQTPQVPFDSSKCLFCTCISNGLDGNIDHMLKKHGLFIPDQAHVIDLETLIQYFHLIVNGYFECLSCGSRRNSAEAAKQHMIGKMHCRIDISEENSEFRGFYDFASDSEDLDLDSDVSQQGQRQSKVKLVKADDIIRLPSGKVLSSRTHVPRQHHHRVRIKQDQKTSTLEGRGATYGVETPVVEEDGASTQACGSSMRIAKLEKQFENHLASLRAADRQSLTHLPIAQQRALLMKSKKQIEKARRDENEMSLKIALKANKTLKK